MPRAETDENTVVETLSLVVTVQCLSCGSTYSKPDGWRHGEYEPRLPRVRLPRLVARGRGHEQSRDSPAPTRICAKTVSASRTDAAEVVVQGGPAADGQAVLLERRERVLVEARLHVDDLAGRVEPRPLDGLLRA